VTYALGLWSSLLCKIKIAGLDVSCRPIGMYVLFVETISALPSSLDADDIEDFCGLAQYYASKTPQSFRRVRKCDIITGS